MQKINIFFRKIILEIVVFVCGAAVMIFELIGSRVVAPYIGTSIYVWTSLIGVILASMSLGYYIGGFLADKKPKIESITTIIFFSAIAIIFLVLTKDLFLTKFSTLPINLEIKSLIISLVLFAPTSFLLGMVSPYAVKLKMIDITKSGRTAGNLYAISTTGSIFGTFLAGFYIIPHFGHSKSLIILSASLLLLTFFLLLPLKTNMLKKIGIICLIFFLRLVNLPFNNKQKDLIADIDTKYNRILISQKTDSQTKRTILSIKTDPSGYQAAIFADNTNDLVFDYTKFYRLFSHFVPHPTSALMIGGCVYTYPNDFIKNFPTAKMDVVEIDPGMTDVARKYFSFKDKKNLTIYHQDARIFLNQTKNKYDVIFGDAFSSNTSIPFQLTTKEAIIREYEALNTEGVIMVNMISAIEGKRGKFARAEYATFKEVFSQVYLFKVKDTKDSFKNQNIMLLALKSNKVFNWENPNQEINQYLNLVWDKAIPADMRILTDDFAPVEYYDIFNK